MCIRVVRTITGSLGNVMSVQERLGVLEAQISVPELIFEKLENVGKSGTKSKKSIGSNFFLEGVK